MFDKQDWQNIAVAEDQGRRNFEHIGCPRRGVSEFVFHGGKATDLILSEKGIADARDEHHCNEERNESFKRHIGETRMSSDYCRQGAPDTCLQLASSTD